MSKQFWSWSNSIESTDSELVIEGDISSESWWGDEATPARLREELAKHKGNLTVSLNSGGGDVFAGVSMYNALKNFDGEVTIRVDGLAASIASVIAMAGEKIIMSPGSMMMIHKPWTVVAGDTSELDKVKEVLDGIESSLIPIYTARTGKTEQEIKDLLSAETWMTADEAVAEGFADEAIEAKQGFSDTIKSMMSGKLAFSMKATEDSMKNLVEKIKASEQEDEATAESDETTETVEEVKETNVTDTTEEESSDDVKSEEVESADAEEAEAKTEVEEKSEATTEEVNNSDTKETIKMSKQDEIAVENIQAKAPVQETAAPKQSVKNYLKSDEAMNVFARILESNPGEMGGESSAKVRNAFKDHLEVKLGVTNPEIFLPTPLITAIQNAFEDGGEIWNRVAKVGADVWNAAWDTEDDVNSNDGRARGYNRDDEEDKAEQVLTFDSRVLRPQFVYKYITLNKEDIKEQRSTGALVTYILSELPQRIVREVERAIVLGDGRAPNDDYKIKEGNPRGFYPMLADAVAGNYFGDTVTIGSIVAQSVAEARDEIRTSGEVILIAKKGFSTAARFAVDNEGRLQFPLGTRAADVFDVSTVIEPDWFNDTNSPDVEALLVVPSAYRVVGDTTIEGFQNFILKTNKQEYLQEIWAGGGLTGRKSVIALSTDASS